MRADISKYMDLHSSDAAHGVLSILYSFQWFVKISIGNLFIDALELARLPSLVLGF